jgi:S1-C subfamily serine protease
MRNALFAVLLITILLMACAGTGEDAPAEAQEGMEPSAVQYGGIPWLGIEFDEDARPATIAMVVPGSPAEEAGLQAGDIVHAMGGISVPDFFDKSKNTETYAPGDEFTLDIERDGERMQVTARLGVKPEE